MNMNKSIKKPFREKLMNLCGMYWWPPTHNDPGIKGPKPRLVTRTQYEHLMKMREECGVGGESCVFNNGKDER